MKRVISTLLLLCILLSSVMLSSCETIATLKDKLSGEGNGEVNKPDDPEGPCNHKLKQLPWSAPTCSKDGKRGAFECTVCHKIYLFSAEKGGLIEADRQPSIPKTEHSVGTKYALALKSGITRPTSFSDYEVVTECALCGKGFSARVGELQSFAPSTKLLYDDKTAVASKREMVDGLVSTTYTFPSSTEVGVHNWVYHNSDSGELEANTKVPFTAGSNRYLLILVKNNSSESVSFRYGAEYYSAYCWSDEITLPAGSYTAFTLCINFSGSDYACYHTIQLTKAIGSDVSLSFSGFYFD